MSDMQMPSRPPLGVGAIIGESFSIMFGNFGAVWVLSLVPCLFEVVFTGLTSGWPAAFGEEVSGVSGELRSGIVSIAVSGFATALVVQLAYDAKLGRRRPLGQYLGPAAESLVAIALQSFAVGVLAVLASLLLLLPGLWVMGVFSVIVPAIVLEKVGFGGMNRSADLTKDYRWPIVGTMVVMYLMIFAFAAAATFFGELVGPGTMWGDVPVIPALVYVAGVAFSYGFNAIFVALIYARLRAIKDGVGLDEIVGVFD